MRHWSHLVERSKLEREYGELGLPSPVEGNLRLKKVVEAVRDCVNLSIMTDQTPPEPVRRAAAESALAGGYIKNYLPLRQKIASYYRTERGAVYDAEKEILLTVGGQFAIEAVLKVLLDPGDEVVLIDPEYATFEPMIAMYGGSPRLVPMKLQRDRWEFDLPAFEAAMSPRTRMVVLSNCQNPTGYVYRPEVVDRMAELIAANDCWLLSDEIWSFLILDRLEFTSFAAREKLHERMVTIFSLSKTFGMSGYRIGALLGPAGLVDEAGHMLRFSCQAVPTISQHAALAALDFEANAAWLEDRKRKLGERTREAAQRLNAFAGVSCAVPESGCFLFPDISRYGLSSQEFCEQAAFKAGVYVLPGYFYGRNADRYVRISCAVPDQDFYRGIDRLAGFLKTLERS